ncbi:MAG: ABC transporter ATP-binding protein [Elusimicrobiaceae bacterium]|nr:ABC transporter ATP-binding protein [Elusimicrobiaceae bacterium]
MFFVLKWLVPYWTRHPARIAVIVALGVLGSALGTAVPLFIKEVIDGLQRNLSAQVIIKYVLMLAGLAVVNGVINLSAMIQRAWMNSRIEYEVRNAVFEHIMRLDAGFFRRFSAGDLLTRLTDDTETKLTWFACSGVFRALQSVVRLVFVLALMLWLNPKLALWALAPVPVFFIVVRTGHVIRRKSDSLQKAMSGAYAALDSCFNGVRIVKANLKESAQEKIFAGMAKTQCEKQLDLTRSNALMGALFSSVGYLCMISVLLGGGRMVIDGRTGLGELMAFYFFAQMLVMPLIDLSNFAVSGRSAEASIMRLQELLSARSALTAAHRPRQLPARIAELEFKNVSCYAPASGHKLLDKISFRAEAGQRIAVVGRIGCGKSTLLNLVPRLMEYDEGEITVNGISVREFSVEGLRSVTGYAPQNAVLFSESVRDNIEMGRPLEPARLARALHIAQLEGELPRLSGGLAAVAGTKGSILSGGQRQRVSVARAVAAGPRILVLDDCASAMDAGTEASFWAALSAAIPGAICLMATHRTRTIAAAHHILVLDSGRIVEQGRHDALMAAGGLYRKIYEHQKLAEEFEQQLG